MNRFALLTSAALLAAVPMSAPVAQTAPAASPAGQSAELKKFFEDYDKAELALSPISKSYRGIKDGDYGKLDEFSDAATASSTSARWKRCSAASNEPRSRRRIS